jgi:methylmalonyl-CoA mutase cobalamin-binding subunit
MTSEALRSQGIDGVTIPVQETGSEQQREAMRANAVIYCTHTHTHTHTHAHNRERERERERERKREREKERVRERER